jgi:hypothetical protein
LTARIATGQRSLFFSHQADYAAATSLSTGPVALAAARRTAFNLVDARLLMQWSRSLEATGDVEGARYLADRLREFRNPTGDTWFASCAEQAFAPVMPQCLGRDRLADATLKAPAARRPATRRSCRPASPAPARGR